MKNSASKAALGFFALLLSASGVTQAAQIYWTDWLTSAPINGFGFTAQGAITTPTAAVTVSYSNPRGVAFYQPSGGTDYWTGGDATTSPYTSSVVDNRPTNTDIVALQYAGTQTLQFSQAIANPVFAFVSLNGNGYGFRPGFQCPQLWRPERR